MKKHKILSVIFFLMLIGSLFGCSALSPEGEMPAGRNVQNGRAAVAGAEEIGNNFVIQFIDVGQADAALVKCDSHYMLIDGGNKADSDIIYTVLQKNNITHLDMVIGTHAHEDHIGGLPGAYQYAAADITLCPVTDYDSGAFRDFKQYAQKNGGGITIPDVGDTYTLGSAEVEILGVNSAEDTNNTSIVLKIIYGDTSFLFTGDAEREAEQVILDSGADLSATVLEVGHHGSDTSTSYPFLRAIMPEYAVISVGTDNTYGHPTKETLSRLKDAGATVYRTDLQGDIFCESDGSDVTFTTGTNTGADRRMAATAAGSSEDTEVSVSQYILNTNTGKFHNPDCSSVENMDEKYKEIFNGTREELIKKGYEPCKRCEP